MIDYEHIQEVIAKGLKNYCKIPVVQSNQDEAPPKGDYLSYTVTVPKNANKGTYGKYEDGAERKPFIQTWSITSISKDETRSVINACKAHEYLDHAGTTYFSDNGIDIQSVSGISNRDNVLSVGYEYKNGFDVFISVFDTIEGSAEQDGYIESVDLGNISAKMPPTMEELNNMLEKRLDGEVV